MKELGDGEGGGDAVREERKRVSSGFKVRVEDARRIFELTRRQE